MAENDKTPFGFYYINREYLEALSKADEHVPKHDYEDEGRARKFYCGPVMNEYGVDYYVPVSSQVRDMYIPGSKENGVKEYYGITLVSKDFTPSGCLDFRFMIPCVDKRFLTEYKPKGFAVDQINFCKDNQTSICRLARCTFNNIQSGDYNFLNETAINNEAITNAAWEHVDQYEARLEAEKKRKAMNRRSITADMTTANISYSDYSNQNTPEEPQ